VDSLASQALVTGLFDEAKSYAAAAAFDYAGAAQYQSAADTMFIVAALAGGSAAALARSGGSGSSSSNTYQYNNGQSDSSNSAGSGRSNVGVQHFAEGGLITAPVKALMGEAGREAVIPLDDPNAQQTMKNAGLGGDTHIHLNVKGLVSPSTLSKVCKQISASVARGQATLNSSSTFKVTKRGG
jgi:hypothetical protein